MENLKLNTNKFVEQIKQIIKVAQIGVVSSANSIMVQTYFNIGKSIVVEE